jgi:tRNA A37 threonylcarbamoyladenosine biosynthesis protein TsaE
MQHFLPDDDATAAFGTALAAELRAGDIVLLEGDLGAGKTALARAIIRALAAEPALEVPSPTFALVQPYETARGPVLHADLYRLGEWAERAPEIVAAATIRVRLAIPPDGAGRNVQVTRQRSAGQAR